MLASIVAILVVAILTVVRGRRLLKQTGKVRESALGSCLERREAIIF